MDDPASIELEDKRETGKRKKSLKDKKRRLSNASNRIEVIDDVVRGIRKMTELLTRNNELLTELVLAVPTTGSGSPGDMEKIMATKIIRRPICVKVDIKCNFLRIINIDTVNQEFEADVFILSKWQDPSFCDMEGSGSELFNERTNWRPRLIIKNCDSGLNKETVTFCVQPNVSGYPHPVVFMGWKFQAVMKENLELQDYPVDVQDLTIQLTSELNIDQLELCEDKLDMSTVNVASFTGAQEWRIYHHVAFTPSLDILEYEIISKRPILHIQCRVARDLWYFLWNVVFIMFVILCEAFSCYAIDPASSDRLVVNITLLLTGVTFKLVVTQSLPRISYLTCLDVYVLAALIFLGVHSMNNSILIYLSSKLTLTQIKFIDRIAILAIVGVICLFHIIFGLKIYILASKKRRLMKQNDREYLKKLKEVGKVRSSTLSFISL